MRQNQMIVLPDVSLCAIVRDEKMNPAGGIKRFVESHVPFVEDAIIVDTGSIDGTREILEEMQAKYSNLKIYDKRFEGFADARNYSLSKVKTKYSPILDADELLTHENPTNEFKVILDLLVKKRGKKDFIFSFDFEHILPSGEIIYSPEPNKRLFPKKRIEYYGEVYEIADIITTPSDDSCHFKKAKAKIRHFLPKRSSLNEKREYLYYPFSTVRKRNISEFCPIKTPGFKRWKAYNLQRDFYN